MPALRLPFVLSFPFLFWSPRSQLTLGFGAGSSETRHTAPRYLVKPLNASSVISQLPFISDSNRREICRCGKRNRALNRGSGGSITCSLQTYRVAVCILTKNEFVQNIVSSVLNVRRARMNVEQQKKKKKRVKNQRATRRQ